MKKLLLILLCLPMIGFGQPYLDLTSTWIVSASYAPPAPGGGATSNTQLYIPSTTMIGVYTYFEIYSTTNWTEYVIGGPPTLTTTYGGPSYLREDGTKWYVYNTVTAVDELLCDFDLLIGDNISTFTASSFLTPAPEIINITNETMFGSITRKKFHLDNGFSFIEGVGNLAGLFSVYAQAFEGGSALACYMQNSQNWGLGPDSLCSLGTLSNTIIEDNTKKELLKVTDLLGRKTKKTNHPLLYIYDDGTVEKRIVIE